MRRATFNGTKEKIYLLNHEIFSEHCVLIIMKHLIPLTIALVIFSLSSCKRVCYQCTQYCAECTSNTDSSIVYKVCANVSGGKNAVNAAEDSLIARNYRCERLEDDLSVCDNKRAIDEATIYFEKQDYFCSLKE